MTIQFGKTIFTSRVLITGLSDVKKLRNVNWGTSDRDSQAKNILRLGKKWKLVLKFCFISALKMTAHFCGEQVHFCEVFSCFMTISISVLCQESGGPMRIYPHNFVLNNSNFMWTKGHYEPLHHTLSMKDCCKCITEACKTHLRIYQNCKSMRPMGGTLRN